MSVSELNSSLQMMHSGNSSTTSALILASASASASASGLASASFDEEPAAGLRLPLRARASIR
eukprot:CAMPEP_0170598714 /NCGR_PEP_ID=MMETSP0224-20130122/16396_1 /TAXON_ID=285029 /ORGANISM="Togula jolla, Strain CCCM 725" /LENGTH=62 /DNA_ID=CAMNT_0010923287 /DNA_START=693 /DNA_END=881 /DNA_ORIENTATION=-